MSCRRTQRWLRAHASGELVPAPAAVREHLARCAECREVEQRQARLTGLLAAQVYDAPPPELRARVLSALAPRPSRRVMVWRLASVAAALAVLLTVTLAQRQPALTTLPGDGQEAGSLAQQHATLASFDPLGDPTALNAMGAVALRHEVLH